MTGLSDTEHIVEGLEAGGVDYVTKPIVAGELLARIRVHLTNARMAQSARTALDAFGRFLFAVDGAGKVLWCTPQAVKLLATALHDFDAEDYVVPDDIRDWLTKPRRRRQPLLLLRSSSKHGRRQSGCNFSTSARSGRTSISSVSSKVRPATIRWFSNPG